MTPKKTFILSSGPPLRGKGLRANNNKNGIKESRRKKAKKVSLKKKKKRAPKN